ncbi:hypothetical protein CGZ80_08090 [Rhodopirellula sp. MGV]|nr:hypothetical protein CGZ80_08090 [Rhodopirellula sp. MGV]PNY34556.1 hypothetical protein C2E31_22905 [Rhodopirellula baltica]
MIGTFIRSASSIRIRASLAASIRVAVVRKSGGPVANKLSNTILQLPDHDLGFRWSLGFSRFLLADCNLLLCTENRLKPRLQHELPSYNGSPRGVSHSGMVRRSL